MYGGARGGGKTDPFIREAMAIHNLLLKGVITKDEEKKLIHAAADRRFGRARKVGEGMSKTAQDHIKELLGEKTVYEHLKELGCEEMTKQAVEKIKEHYGIGGGSNERVSCVSERISQTR